MTWFSLQNSFAQNSNLILVAGGGGGSGANGLLGGAGGGNSGANGIGANGVFPGGGTQTAGGAGGVATSVYGYTVRGTAGYAGNGGHSDDAYSYTSGGGGGGSGYIKNTLTSASTTQGGGSAAATNGSLSITTNYPTSGTFTSSAINTGGFISGTLSYSATLNGQTLTMQARSADNEEMTGADEWGTCSITNGANLSTSPCIHSGDSYIQYQASLSTTDTAQTPTLDSVTISTNGYNSNGDVISQPFNTVDPATAIGELIWDQSATPLPAGTTVTVSLRASATLEGLSSASWYDFTENTANCSLDGTIVTCPDLAIPEVFDSNAQYWQYKITETSTGANTPTVSSITVKYVRNAPPEVQNVTASQGTDGLVTITYSARDTDSNSGTVTQGEVTPSFQYWDGDSWETCVTLSTGATDNLDTSSQDWTATQTVTWDPKTDFNEEFQNNTAKIQVTINDNEGANNTDTAESAVFTLDTKPPVITDMDLNASTDPAEISITSSDDSTYQMRIAQDTESGDADCEDNLALESYITYNSTPTIDLNGEDPQTICLQLKDQYNNESEITSIDSPETPTAFMVQDTTNTLTDPDELRLFTAWKISSEPDEVFSKYELYRSTDNTTFSKIFETYTKTTNSYPDNTVAVDTNYYYKVKTIDSSNNQSFYSETIQAKANGIQDYGEGGGGTSSAPPVIDNVEIETAKIYTSQATITWETDVPSNSTVGYSTTEGSFTTEVGTDTMYDFNAENHYGPHTVVLTNLTPDTDYYFQVKSTSTSGITGTDDNADNNHLGYHFKTLPGPKITEDSVTISKITNTTATINWQTDIDASSSITYSESSTMDTTENFLGTNADSTDHEVTITGLSQGTRYYFYVQSEYNGDTATDDNQGTYYTFITTEDLTSPTITFNPSTDISKTTTTAKINFTTSEQATSTLEYGLTNAYGTELTSDNLNINQVFDLEELTPNTTYHFKITATDENNNPNVNSNTDYTFTTNAEESQEGPSISEVAVSDITYDSAKVSWVTGEEGNSLVDYGTTENTFPNTQGSSTVSSTIHEVLLNGLNSVTTYYYQIKTQDSNNNTTIKSTDDSDNSLTFTTLSPTEDTDSDGEGDQLTDIMSQIQSMIDSYYFTEAEIQSALSGLYSIAITSSGPSVDITNNEATITWTTNRPSIGKIYYWQDTDNEDTKTSQSEITTIALTNHEVILKNLNAGTKYNYYAESTGLLNSQAISSTQSFTTEDIPQISGIAIDNITLNSADISWTASDSIDSSQLEYGEDTTYGNEENGKTNNSLHTVNLTSLKENTTYHLRVKGEDSAGQTLVSNDYSFTTVSLPIITNVQIKDITSESALISWNTNVKTDSRVEFKKDNQDQGTTNGKLEAVTDHSYQITNLFPGTKYTFKVSSKDSFNNESSSEEQSFTTEEDLNPPTIQNVKSDTTVFPGKEAQIQTIISWNTDKDTNSILAYRQGVEKDYSLIDKLKDPNTTKVDNWQLVKKSDLTKNHLFVLTDLKPASVYQFRTASFDKHGNVSVSENYSLLTPTKQQSVLDLIIQNFESTFGWVKKIGN